MNDDGQIEIFPESTAEIHALRGWNAKYPVCKCYEFVQPLEMRMASGLKLHTPTIELEVS